MRKLIKSCAVSFLALFTAVLCTGCDENSSVFANNEYSVQSDEIVLRLANNHVDDYPTSKACDYFAQLVEERTDGKIKILCYHNSALGDEASTLKQVQLGGIDFVRVSVSLLAEYDTNLNILSLPYLYENSNHMWSVLNSETGDYFLNSTQLIKNGFEGLCWYTGGSRNFYSTQPLDNGIESLKGLKIRTQESELLQDTVSALGADAVPMKFEDVYAALVTGKIDAAENNIPSYISTQHYKDAKYMILDEHSSIPEMIVVSKTTMDNLNHEQQEIIKECAKESTEKQIELWNEYENECLETAISEGCTIITPTEEQKEEFKEAVQAVKDKYSAGYEDLIKKIENTPYNNDNQ
jgi:tripartite ATP-independent transporter DctP family solute receptor